MHEPAHAEYLLSDHVIGIVGLICGVVGLMVTVGVVFLAKETREKSTELAQLYGRKMLYLLAFLLLLVSIAAAISRVSLPGAIAFLVVSFGITFAVWRTGNLHGLQQENADLQGRLATAEHERDAAVAANTRFTQELQKYERVAGNRWNLLKEIRFGHLTYEPFLMYRMGNLVGFGVEMLHTLLEFSDPSHSISVLPYRTPKTWDDVLKGLGPDTYQVVATPLFATFDRSREAAFTSPLFFSNIGLYVRSDIAAMFVSGTVAIDDLKETIRKLAVRLTFLSVPGEISAKLAAKYADPSAIQSCDGDILGDLFERIADKNSPPLALFCESFYAYHQPSVRARTDKAQLPNVVNILPWHDILYPVCFAVRLGDHQLRNLLNLRLLDFGKNVGALNYLEKKLPEYNYDVTDLRKHFVEEWPAPSPQNGSSHA